MIILRPVAASTADREVAAARLDQGERCAAVPEQHHQEARRGALRLPLFGNNDTLTWSRPGEEEEQGRFTGSPDKHTVFIPKAGHFVMFSRTAPLFDTTLSDWLSSRFP